MLSPSGIYFKFAYFLVKIRLLEGKGSPKFVFHWNPNIFVTYEPIQNLEILQ